MIDEPLPQALSAEINAVLDEAGVHTDRRLVMRMLRTAILLGEDGTSRLDLKIASAALAEMRDAFRLFAPFHGVPKVTVFGSARTRTDDALYVRARDIAAALATSSGTKSRSPAAALSPSPTKTPNAVSVLVRSIRAVCRR